MIEVITRFTPFRMKLARREPVQLSVEVVNKGNENAIVSTSLDLGANLSLEKSGYKTAAAVRIPKLPAGERRIFYYELWPKQSARVGTMPIGLKVLEHYRDFNYVKQEYKKNLGLIVED